MLGRTTILNHWVRIFFPTFIEIGPFFTPEVYLFISLICCVFDTWTNTAWMWFTWEIIPMFQLHNLSLGASLCMRVSLFLSLSLSFSLPMHFGCLFTSSTAQGGGGSFKNRKPIGEIGCCESGMAERSHWWTERCLISLTLSLSFSGYLPTYPSIFYVSIYLSTY